MKPCMSWAELPITGPFGHSPGAPIKGAPCDNTKRTFLVPDLQGLAADGVQYRQEARLEAANMIRDAEAARVSANLEPCCPSPSPRPGACAGTESHAHLLRNIFS